MSMDKTFFMGANTSDGFFSLFDTLYDPDGGFFIYILKGGPGTGKSSLMRRVADKVKKEGFETERIICTADPSSLDAVIFPQLRASIVDGTAPHVMEPRFPGLSEEIINLGDFRDPETLMKNADEIRMLYSENSAMHSRAARFISAAAGIQEDSRRIACLCADKEKILNFSKRLAARELKAHGRDTGKITRRFVSGVTPDGFFVHYDTIGMCSRIIALEDEYGVCAPVIIDELARSAAASGYDCTLCRSPLMPRKRSEHLIIPELSLCVMTRNSLYSTPFTIQKRIHASRFLDVDALRAYRHRLGFNQKAQNELLREAVSILSAAKSVHDTLEEYYKNAMDFESVSLKCDELTQKILSRG